MAFALISLLIPIAFGVSTRTSEGDRLLYFPSCFICMLLIAAILLIFKNASVRWLWFSGITIYFLCFLEINNMRWEHRRLQNPFWKRFITEERKCDPDECTG